MSQAPRRINTDRSLHRPDQAAKAAPRPAAGTTGTSGRPAAGSTSGSGRSAPPRHSAQPARQAEPPRRRKKKKKTPLWLPFAVVMAVIAVVSGVVVYGVSMLNKVEDSLRPDDSTPTIQEEVKTAEEYKGDVVNILVCGIDYEEGRNYSDASSNDGMTDMILYCQFDIKNGALHMLQIPRNSLVATQNRKITLSNGKTYAASNYQINSVALSNGGSIAALADVIYDQYRLPVDYYVSVDMQALVEMVDNFGGIEVYVPVTMEYDGSRLEQGWRVLMGAECEFFLRQRKDTSATPRGDIDRLANQQYFYSALFRRVRTATVGDIIKLTPVVQKYINTSLNFMELVQLGMSVLSIPSENIIIGRLPVARGELYNGQDVMVCAKAETAEFLNEYFRPADDPLAAQQIGTPDWGTRSEVIGAEVRRMGEVDAVGGSDANAPADAQQAAQQANAASVQQPAA